MKYQEIRQQISSFDILLFSGKGHISNWIKRVTNSRWSHIGLALVLDEYDCVVLFESTTLSNAPDLILGRGIKGVQLVNLSLRMKDYNGDVGWRHIEGPRTSEMKRSALQFVRDFHGRPYEKNQLELIKSALDISGLSITQNQEDASSVFCSELAALMLRHVGMMGGKLPSNEYTPADFEKRLPLKVGYHCDEVCTIKPDATRST